MKIPKQITKEIIDEMIPVWEELAEKGWNGLYPYSGLCQHFGEIAVFDFLKNNFDDDFGIAFIRPIDGKEGAQKRVEILKKIREHL